MFRRPFHSLLLGVFCLGTFLPAPPLFAQNELLRSTLSSLGRDSASIGFRPLPTWGTVDRTDPFRLPWFDGLLARPLKIPTFTRELLHVYTLRMKGDTANWPRPLIARVRPVAGLITQSARALGHDVGKYGFDYTPAVAEHSPLLAAIRSVYEERGRDLGSNIVYPLPTQHWTDLSGRFGRQIAALPPGLEQPIASLVESVREAARWRDHALRRIPRDQWQHIFTSTTLEESQCDAHTFDQIVYDAAMAVDVSSMSWGAMQLSHAIEKSLPALRAHAGAAVTLDIPTPIGRIVVRGGGNDLHYATDCALVVDLGGDDTYVGSIAASSPLLPISVAIDLAGDDRYTNAHEGVPAQGAGVLGIGMLFDLAGDDHYESRTFSQGCGRFGVGVLHDVDGDDVYASLGFSQGAGLYGIGVLFDKSGDDAYNTVYYAQGYGFSKGLGLLADAAGSDRYTADDTDLIHVGDETPKHNESDAQGYGAGRRGDHTDGHNMSGGLGILHDLGGDDAYSAGVFAQGSGYWYGMGVLNDAAGNDTYRGVFFNLGAAAHYAIGVLFDDAGNDRTDLVMTLGLGTAHDASAAFYIDADGDDVYTMSEGDERACSLGSALNNSFALFANIRGNDRYAPVGNAFGYGTGRRGGEWGLLAPTTGLFFDIGGNDVYEPTPPRKGFTLSNGATWRQQEDRDGGVFGVGHDVDAGMLRFE